MKKIRKKYLFALILILPMIIFKKKSIHQVIKDEEIPLLFYNVRPKQRREETEKELEAKNKMIEQLAQQLKYHNQARQ